MATAPFTNNFEGGTNATDISTGNSGGTSGTAVSAVTSTAGSLQFSNTQARNTLSMVAIEGGTYAATYASWTGMAIAGGTDVYARIYMYLPTALGGNSPGLFRWITAAAATSSTLRPTTSSFVQFQDASSTNITASLGTVAIATLQWVRLEMRHRASATVGQIEWRLFNTADSVTADDTKNATGLVLGADTDGIRVGQITSTGIASSSIYFDDLAVSTAGWIGPSVVTPTLPDVVMAPYRATPLGAR